ncbi:outer membrane beta-barrel protein [uncultured Tenacibaculum sp.]|uniref:outer membrane beta-barrel protein n=1 Tax=uncultured Tenacibaculum sp. TaxID=174713 RepID=UPI002627C342|nr:outer membrane beta-barrel protein [uncultured Tenacibaculum sp.]
MKKLLLVAMMAFGVAMNAQDGGELNVGGTIGLPIGDSSEANVTGSIEANYLFNVSEDFKVGPAVSYLHFQQEGADVAFLPLAVASRYSVSEKFVIGADLGYGLGVRPSGFTQDGFYYRPVVGYKVTDKITIHADYSNVSLDNATASTIGLGGTYSFSF